MSAAHGFWKPPDVVDRDLSLSRSGAAATYGGRNSSQFETHRTRPRPASHHLSADQLSLPINKHRRQIIYAVQTFRTVVIVGETGSGKSTQIPQYLLSNGWCENGFQVVCTQPRRIAATTLAERVAQQQSNPRHVGSTVRFADLCTSETKIKFVTDGILLQEAVSDPLLSRYSVVMMDEAHERTINSDLLAGLLLKIRRKRPELRLIICSATVNAQAFLNFFAPKQKNSSAVDGTIISVDGRQYPMEYMYLEKAASDYIVSMVETARNVFSSTDAGDILCFLPTSEDIDRAIRLAEEQFDATATLKQKKASAAAVDFLPLYGNLPHHMQARIFKSSGDRTAKRRRRIIFATNIAETSVTVPNIQVVIDSGLVKLPFFDPVSGLERLVTTHVSRASAEQRAGRAGRICAGKVYRLYTEHYLLHKMPAHTVPEILRTNLTSFLLMLKRVGVDNILAFDLMDIPSVKALQHGLESLYALGAIDKYTNITDAGLDMAHFPVEPRISRMLLESLKEGCAWEVLAVAGAMQVRELFERRPRPNQMQQMLDYEAAMSDICDPSGDHVTHANLFAETDDRGLSQSECRERFINYLSLRRGVEIRNQLARLLRRFGKVDARDNANGHDNLTRTKMIRRCVAAGFFFNVAKLGNDGRYYTLRKNVMVSPSPNSIFTNYCPLGSEYIVFSETADAPRGGIELRSVSAIEAKWLRDVAPHYWE